jgi:hypothetical protein
MPAFRSRVAQPWTKVRAVGALRFRVTGASISTGSRVSDEPGTRLRKAEPSMKKGSRSSACWGPRVELLDARLLLSLSPGPPLPGQTAPMNAAIVSQPGGNPLRDSSGELLIVAPVNDHPGPGSSQFDPSGSDFTTWSGSSATWSGSSANWSGSSVWPNGNRFPASFKGFSETGSDHDSPVPESPVWGSGNPAPTSTAPAGNGPAPTSTAPADNTPGPTTQTILIVHIESNAGFPSGPVAGPATTSWTPASSVEATGLTGRAAATSPSTSASPRATGETSPGTSSENVSLTITGPGIAAFPMTATATSPVLPTGPAGPPLPPAEVRVGNGTIGLNSTNSHPVGIVSWTVADLPTAPIAAVDSIGGAESGLPRGVLPAPPRPEVPFDPPMPQGSGLITRFIPFDRTSLDESLARFLDRFGDDAIAMNGQQPPLPYPLLFVTALAAIEATRRWRRRYGSSGAAEEWKMGSPTLHGLS